MIAKLANRLLRGTRGVEFGLTDRERSWARRAGALMVAASLLTVLV